MKSKNTFQRGFTLIELMIVIVILGILMGTILPRLTGAQGRARDTSRRADLANLAQALEVYYNDNNSYPAGNGCLAELKHTGADAATTDAFDPAGGAYSDTVTPVVNVAAMLKVYLKGNRIIQPATTNLNSNGCIGSYYYSSLMKGGVVDSAYVIVSQMETYQMANYDMTTGASATNGGPIATVLASTNPEPYSLFAGVSNTNLKTADSANSNDSVYFVIP